MSEHRPETDEQEFGNVPIASGGGRRIKRELESEPLPEQAATVQSDQEFLGAVFEQAEQDQAPAALQPELQTEARIDQTGLVADASVAPGPPTRSSDPIPSALELAQEFPVREDSVPEDHVPMDPVDPPGDVGLGQDQDTEGADGSNGHGGAGGSGGGEEPPSEGRRRRRRSKLPGCLIALVILALVGGGLYVAVDKGMDWVSAQFSETEDYPGPGGDNVLFEVASGDSAAQMGRNLKAAGVVKSVQAFIDAAAAEDRSSGIQVGFYSVQEQMRASDVVTILIEPKNRVSNRVTIPEGMRVVDVVDIVEAKTDFTRKQIQAALKDGPALGLPAWAGGNPEGYLFPATYEIGPKDTAASLMKTMVTRWKQAADEADLEAKAKALGYTPNELMIVASLVQAEGRGDDMPKIARVIYNRIENPKNGITNGLVQVDASVNYGLGEKGIARLTTEQLAVETPYNVYLNTGLPPTPINSPGDAAIDAAAHPAKGDWLFYVTVNLKTGETKFVRSYDDFLGLKNELNDYCANESDAC